VDGGDFEKFSLTITGGGEIRLPDWSPRFWNPFQRISAMSRNVDDVNSSLLVGLESFGFDPRFSLAASLNYSRIAFSVLDA
jgi:hypothetical protein